MQLRTNEWIYIIISIRYNIYHTYFETFKEFMKKHLIWNKIFTTLTVSIMIPSVAVAAPLKRISFQSTGIYMRAYQYGGGHRSHSGIINRMYANGSGNTYCVQPGEVLRTGVTMRPGHSNRYRSYSEQKKRGIGLAIAMGKGCRSADLVGNDHEKWLATQIIVWEIITGARSATSFEIRSRAIIRTVTNKKVMKNYAVITASLKEYAKNKIPSFSCHSLKQAGTHVCKVRGNGKEPYRIKLTDTNHVLGQFKVKSTNPLIHISKRSNTLSIQISKKINPKKFTASITLERRGSGRKIPIQIYGSNGYQDIVEGTSYIPAVRSYVRLKAEKEITHPIQIIKKDAWTHSVIGKEGTVFQIISKADHKVVSIQGKKRFTTGPDGIVSIPNLLKKGTYELIELKAPHGYKREERPIVFHIEKTGTKKIIEVKDRPQQGRITLHKFGKKFYGFEKKRNGYRIRYRKSNLANAVFEIRAKNPIRDEKCMIQQGEVVDRIKSDVSGRAQSRLLPIGVYEIREVEAPEGYELRREAFEIELKGDRSGEATVECAKSMENELCTSQIHLSKRLESDKTMGSENLKRYKYITFGLFTRKELHATDGSYIKKDECIESVTADKEGGVMFKTRLPIGSYYIKELATDVHYVLSDKEYDVEILPDSGAIVEVLQGKAVWNRLKRGCVWLRKTDGKQLIRSGQARFVLYLDVNGNHKIDRFDKKLGSLHGKNGVYIKKNLITGEYLLQEEHAPKGYRKDNKVYSFQIREDNEKVEIENQKGKGFVNKKRKKIKSISQKKEKKKGERYSAPKTGDKTTGFWIFSAGLSSFIIWFCLKRKTTV